MAAKVLFQYLKDMFAGNKEQRIRFAFGSGTVYAEANLLKSVLSLFIRNDEADAGALSHPALYLQFAAMEPQNLHAQRKAQARPLLDIIVTKREAIDPQPVAAKVLFQYLKDMFAGNKEQRILLKSTVSCPSSSLLTFLAR